MEGQSRSRTCGEVPQGFRTAVQITERSPDPKDGRRDSVTTDTSEKGLERLICTALTGAACDPAQEGAVHEQPSGDGAGWICGHPHDYNRDAYQQHRNG